jgi:L-aspartate oxidase
VQAGARRLADALSQPAQRHSPPGERELQALRELPAPPLADPATRAALWRDAGVVRTPEALNRLLESPHPLARLIARCALARTESRGAHLRADHPERDPAFDLRHAVLTGEDATDSIDWQTWA